VETGLKCQKIGSYKTCFFLESIVLDTVLPSQLRPSVRLSVRLSDNQTAVLVIHAKTVKNTEMRFGPHDTLIYENFLRVKFCVVSLESHPKHMR